ncbi:MAG: hypothetical protein IJC07_00330 [Clostridia bacterium]|nr:hypothetical protein [Clostridia bacterium]
MNIHIDKKVKICLITLLCLLVTICTCGIFCVQKTAKADQQQTFSVQLNLPKTNLEQFDLSSPIFTYHDEDVTAIAQSNKTLIVYYNGKYTVVEQNNLGQPMFEDLRQVHRLDEDTLLVLDRAVLYTIDLNDLTANKVAVTHNGNSVSGTCLDFDGEHLVLSYNTYIHVYEVENGQITNMNNTDRGAQDTPIALNGMGDMFFIDKNDDLIKLPVESLGTTPVTLLEDASINHMIATDTSLYYISDRTINVLDLATNESTKLDVEKEEGYDLGQLLSPVSLWLKGDKLLVTDSALNAIQEFKITDNKLVFTGFAIAKGKTAYNRIQNDSLNGDVQKLGDKVAVLDGDMLSIINTASADAYARENYVNFLFGEDQVLNKDTNLFALGKDKFIAVETPRTSPQRVLLLNADGTEGLIEVDLGTENYHANRVTYRNGWFYILINDALYTKVYALSEQTIDGKATQIISINENAGFYTFIEVDVFGGFYLAKENQIVKYQKGEDGNYQSVTPTPLSVNGLIKMQTDLAGTLFVLDSQGLKAFDQDNNVVNFTQSVVSGKINSFSLDFISKEVYLLIEGQEKLFTSTDLPNLCVDEITVPTSDFITTDSSANLNNLTAFKPKADASVYKVNLKEGKFAFDKLLSSPDQYLLICPVEIDSGLKKTTLYALAGQDQIVLINKDDCEQVEVSLLDAPEKAFVTVGVNMYFMPIVTPNSEYALTEQGVIKLEKGTEIKPQKLLNVFGKEFYFATATIDGKEYSGYVPTAFTVEVLSKDFAYQDYTIKTVKKTTLYQDQKLSNPLLELTGDQQVKVIWEKDGIAFVIVDTDNGAVEGYIDADKFTNHPKTAIRNSLLILVVAASVFATSTYFILRKKENN